MMNKKERKNACISKRDFLPTEATKSTLKHARDSTSAVPATPFAP
jgi:hypothetical protein